MIQIATYLIPQQQEEANEFLKTHKPEGNINFNRDTVVIFYDNGETSPEYQMAEYRELLESNANAKYQQELAKFVLERQLADLKSERSVLNTKHNKGRVEEVDNLISQITNGISQCVQAMLTQDIKAEFVQGKIDTLKSDN